MTLDTQAIRALVDDYQKTVLTPFHRLVLAEQMAPHVPALLAENERLAQRVRGLEKVADDYTALNTRLNGHNWSSKAVMHEVEAVMNGKETP